MKKIAPVLASLLLVPALAMGVHAQTAGSAEKNTVHRYLIERTFPAGALKGLDAATKNGGGGRNVVTSHPALYYEPMNLTEYAGTGS